MCAVKSHSAVLLIQGHIAVAVACFEVDCAKFTETALKHLTNEHPMIGFHFAPSTLLVLLW